MNPKLKNLIKIIIILFILILIWKWFHYINNKNYIKFREIKYNKVNHPENLPTSEFAKATAFWFENVKSDIYWLETIQYIWWNAASSAYKKYLYKIINLITDLNPYFVHSYNIWMLLLPDYNHRYENLEKEEQLEYINQWVKLWLKWIKNFCNEDKIELIKKEDNLQNIWTLDKYKNPCKSYEIPYYLAFIYYFYLHDNIKASNYYKIASANTDSLEWAKILSAIMKGKWWDREKAFLMFLNIWKNLDTSENLVCSKFTDILQNKIGFNIFQKNNLDYKLIQYASDLREKVFPKSDWKDENLKSNPECSKYVNKAIRELNLYYIEEANKIYKKNTWKNAKNAKVLFEWKYIDYLPVDFQQYEDYGIIYEYNSDTWFFDYTMGNY